MGDDGEDSKIVVIFFLRLVRLVAVLVVIGLARGGCVVERVG